MKGTGLVDAWMLSEVEVQLKLDDEKTNYKKAKRLRATKLRRCHVAACSTAPARAKDMSAKKRAALSRSQPMQQKEETRRRRAARGKGNKGGLVQIQVAPPSGGPCVTCSTRRLVEDGCMQENQARYDQTRFPFPTPPMTEPLYSMFNGPSAEANSMALLQGVLEPPSDDPILCSFFDHCRRPKGLQAQPLRVTLDNHVSFWSRMKEQRGSEPHGLHNGHFKAGATSVLLSQCDAQFRALPFSSGMVPAKWRHLMNFAIEKKPGEIRVTKMRTIQMMNSELQANNKLVGKMAMRYAERHDLIPSGQCGARKRHQAIDLALTKRLTWDLLILQRRAAGWISNDAKSCFDRIVHWVAIISLLRFGIPWATLRSMFDTLMLAEHRVRTGFGDSPRVFRPPSAIPFQGCGQGNGAGPTIWVAVSSILLGMMITRGFGFECLSALSWTAVIASCFAFMDDTDVSQAAPSVYHSGESILPSVQSSLTWWSTAIRLTGGALNPAKCFWWLIDFRWDGTNGRWLFRRQSDFSASQLPKGFSSCEMVTADLDGSPVALTWLEPDQSERTLGVMMSPLSRADSQFDVLRQKASDWASTVRSGHLLPYDALPLLKTTIMKTLEYPMALTTLSRSKWEEIMRPVLQTVLPKAGVCRKFPRAVVYAPLRFQGLGVPHPFGLQMAKHLDMLLRHPANALPLSPFLEANLQAHRLETGTSFDIFQQDFANTGVLASDTWVKRVWRLLDRHGIYLEFDSKGLSLHRVGDRFLMDLFIAAGVDQDTLKWLNWCRIYLKVVTLSDIVTADGTQIRLEAWEGRPDSHQVDRFQWPRSCRPSPQRWDLWRHWLSVVVLGHSSNRTLTTPLGPWLSDEVTWRWRYSPSSQRLFHLQGGGWVEATARSRRRARNFFLPDHSRFTPSLPSDCVMVSVSRPPSSSRSSLSSRRVTLLGLGPVAPAAPPPTTIQGYWALYLSQVSGSSGWVLERLWVDGDEAVLLAALLAGELLVVCDGSFKAGIGTACAQLRPRDGSAILWILCRTPGRTLDQSSSRSELAGIMASALAVFWLSLLAGMSSSRSLDPLVQIGCDGLGPLQKCFDDAPLPSSTPNLDMVSTIRSLFRRLPVAFRGRHVRGHADRRKPLSQLDWWELRNLEVDQRAQAFREELECLSPPPALNPRFFFEPSAVFVGGEKWSSLSVPRLLAYLELPFLQEYWYERSRISPAKFAEVDWDVVEAAMTALPPRVQRWATKHTMGMCGVGKFRHLWGSDTSSACPRCDSCPIEDHLHVVRCLAPSAIAEWDLRFTALRVWMEANQTAPSISLAVACFLRALRSPATTASLDHAVALDPSLFHAAVASQRIIGSQGLIEGLLSHAWLPLQQRHLDRIGSDRSAPLWASRLSQQLILLGRFMWKQRNEVQHSEDNSKFRGRHLDVDRSIAEQYAMGPADLPPHIRSMLSEPRSVVLRRPLEAREHWLRVVSREWALCRRTLARQRRMIYELLHPGSSSTRPSAPPL